MENDQGVLVDLYVPRKCSATNQLITSKDHASIQISVVDVDAEGKALSTTTSFALCGQVRANGEADDSINRLATKAGYRRSCMSNLWKRSRGAQPEASAGSKGYRPTIFFQRNESNVTQASDVEAARKLASKAPTAPRRSVPVPVPTTTAIYHKQPQSSSRSFSVVHNGNSRDSVQDHRNAHSTSRGHAPQSQMQAPVFEPQLQQAPIAQKTSSKPAAPVPAHAHRVSVSVQSLNSTNTASTSRSSFERISQDNLQHSWHSATLSTAPSSNPPPSTENLTRIFAATADKREPSTVDRQLSASRRFPLVESDSQKKPIASTTHAVAQGEQPSNALPLPNSDHESPARVRSLRRSKGPITSGSDSFVASQEQPFSPITGRESPTTDTQNPPAPFEHQGAGQGHMRRTSDMLEIAYVRQSRIVSEDYGTDTNRATLLARVMGAGAMKHSSSTAASRTMSNTHQPRVSTTANPANPNMLRLKQTTVPRIPSSGVATASPAVESSRLSSVHSPRQNAESAVPAWNYTRSPIVTSGPTYGALKSTVMSPHLSTVASPRTLVSSAHPHHPSDLPPIPPSQYPTSTSYRVQQEQDFRDDESSISTAQPATPTSTTVRALFSSLTSRPHRNSTPHPLRTSVLINQPIVGLDNRNADISTPPPLPPPSTRPDAPQQRESRDFGLSSPRQTVADSTRAKTATASRRDSSGLRSPSPTQSSSILKSYGLENNPVSPSTPSKIPLSLIGTPLGHGQRTLMSDSEYTVTTSVVQVRQTTVVHSSAAIPPVERRSSSSQKLERAGSTLPTHVEVPPSPQVRPQPQPQPQPQFTQSSQRIATSPEPTREPQPAPNVRPATGGLFNMFRPKSPRPFPMVERSASPAPVSKTPPPRASTASPRRFPFSFPMNFRPKPKKSISGASVEAVIGGTTKLGMTDGAMSSQGSLRDSASPDHRVEFSGAKANDKKFLAKLNNERKERERVAHAEPEYDETEDDRDNDEGLYLDRMVAVQKWSMSTEANFKQTGKSRRPGVSFDIPASESERDDSGLTQVSVAPGGGRSLRYAHNHAQQYSDAESCVY